MAQSGKRGKSGKSEKGDQVFLEQAEVTAETIRDILFARAKKGDFKRPLAELKAKINHQRDLANDAIRASTINAHMQKELITLVSYLDQLIVRLVLKPKFRVQITAQTGGVGTPVRRTRKTVPYLLKNIRSCIFPLLMAMIAAAIGYNLREDQKIVRNVICPRILSKVRNLIVFEHRVYVNRCSPTMLASVDALTPFVPIVAAISGLVMLLYMCCLVYDNLTEDGIHVSSNDIALVVTTGIDMTATLMDAAARRDAQRRERMAGMVGGLARVAIGAATIGLGMTPATAAGASMIAAGLSSLPQNMGHTAPVQFATGTAGVAKRFMESYAARPGHVDASLAQYQANLQRVAELPILSIAPSHEQHAVQAHAPNNPPPAVTTRSPPAAALGATARAAAASSSTTTSSSSATSSSLPPEAHESEE